MKASYSSGGHMRKWSGRQRALRSASAVAVLTGSGAALLPASVSAQTLQDAWARAYYTNPTLEAQRAQLRATDEQVNQALSGWRPTIEATSS